MSFNKGHFDKSLSHNPEKANLKLLNDSQQIVLANLVCISIK